MLPSYVDTVRTTEMPAEAGSYTVTLPSYVADDLILIEIYNENSAGATNTTASATGWFQLDNRSGNVISSRRVILMYRVMTAADVSGSVTTVTFTFGGSSTGNNRAVANSVSIRGANPASPFDGPVVATTYSGGSTSIASGTLATTGSDRLIYGFYSLGWNSGSSNGFTVSTVGATERFDTNAVFSSRASVGIELPAATKGNYSISGTEGLASAGVSILVAIKPKTAAEPIYVDRVRTTTGSTQTASPVIALPAYSVGDTVILYVTTVNNLDNLVAVTASGWTERQSAVKVNGWTRAARVLTRKMDGSEGSTVTLSAGGSFPGSTTWVVDATSYSGVADTPFDGSITVAQNAPSNSTFSSGNVTTTGDHRTILGMWCIGTGASTLTCSTTGAVERWEDSGLAGEELIADTASTYSLTCIGSSTFESLMFTGALVPAGPASTEYTDSATIGSTTTPSFTEVANLVDASTITSRSTPSFAEVPPVYVYTDADTISSKTAPVFHEVHEYIDSATISSITELLLVEIYCHVEPLLRGSIQNRWSREDTSTIRWSATLTARNWSATDYAWSASIKNKRWNGFVSEEALVANVC